MQTHQINIYDSISNKEVRRFDNGWLVAIAHLENTKIDVICLSKDNGITWQLLKQSNSDLNTKDIKHYISNDDPKNEKNHVWLI